LTEIALTRRRLDRELNALASFYQDLSYGPFSSCYGYREEDIGFTCEDDLYSKSAVKFQFNTSFSEPGRKKLHPNSHPR